MKWRNRGKLPAIIITIVLLLFLLFPFFVMISTMLKSSEEVYVSPPTWIPQQFHFSNFITVWSEFELFIFFRSSIIIAVGATILNTLLTVPAAYAVARLRFVGRKFILYLFLVIQMFSPVIVIISLFKIMAGLNLLNTYFSLIIANTVFTIAFTIWMINGYFKSIPVEIEEAALIDGCSRVQTITRIMLPIAVPSRSSNWAHFWHVQLRIQSFWLTDQYRASGWAAIRRARAVALKMASAMWWLLWP